MRLPVRIPQLYLRLRGAVLDLSRVSPD